MSRFLLLETSSQPGFVAVAQDEVVLAERPLAEARRQARDLAPTVADLLREQGWKPSDVDAVLTTRGPGSYTGLRVGLMSAKTLAYATGCKLIALETFAVIAAQATVEASPLAVIADAQQGRAYIQEFAGGQATSALRIEMLGPWLTTSGAAHWLSGPGARKRPAESRAVSADIWDPLSAFLLRLGRERFERGESDAVHAVEPLYLRPSAAEEQWRQLGR